MYVWSWTLDQADSTKVIDPLSSGAAVPPESLTFRLFPAALSVSKSLEESRLAASVDSGNRKTERTIAMIDSPHGQGEDGHSAFHRVISIAAGRRWYEVNYGASGDRPSIEIRQRLNQRRWSARWQPPELRPGLGPFLPPQLPEDGIHRLGIKSGFETHSNGTAAVRLWYQKGGGKRLNGMSTLATVSISCKASVSADPSPGRDSGSMAYQYNPRGSQRLQVCDHPVDAGEIVTHGPSPQQTFPVDREDGTVRTVLIICHWAKGGETGAVSPGWSLRLRGLRVAVAATPGGLPLPGRGASRTRTPVQGSSGPR